MSYCHVTQIIVITHTTTNSTEVVQPRHRRRRQPRDGGDRCHGHADRDKHQRPDGHGRPNVHDRRLQNPGGGAGVRDIARHPPSLLPLRPMRRRRRPVVVLCQLQLMQPPAQHHHVTVDKAATKITAAAANSLAGVGGHRGPTLCVDVCGWGKWKGWEG
ncbi:hypothetical protein QJS10_CPA03g00482 [Acorus calamus]|uniref:Uncharacterized protein n=1 Tax=Acorus calamus TaxID=4465 RepID=A0AAV9F8A0_ACOCL|nr:hypothetical protein QJS10_CPA03g00482 [Acorus calamus]